MARIALIDAGAGTATALQAVAAGHELVRCGADGVPADADLLVVDVAHATAAGAALPGGSAGTCPVLLLVEPGCVVDTPSFGSRPLSIVEKPCDLLDLRLRVRALLEAQPAAAAVTPDAGDVIADLSLPAPAAATFAAAVDLGGAVWIVGEAGTGADRVAAALALAWDSGREPVVWHQGDSPGAALARLRAEGTSDPGDGRRVLWVPALEERPLRDQHAFEHFLALDPARRVVVTSGDDPDQAVAAGTLLRTLHHRLSRLALRLPPLRERHEDIEALARAIGRRVAASAFGAEHFTLFDDAAAALAAYPWPGNLLELEAVMTRSVIARGRSASILVGSEHLQWSPSLFPGSPAPAVSEAPAASPAVRRAVVVRLVDAVAADPAAARPLKTPAAAQQPADAGADAAARPLKTSAAASQPTAQAPEPTGIPLQPETISSGVEAVLAAFAHDLRNPMSTIKTFAGLAAAGSGDQAELARLATDACERIDEQLEFLQRYAELSGGDAPFAKDRRAVARVDAVDVLGDAIDAAGGTAGLEITARGAMWARSDPALARFVADAVVAECRSRLGGSEHASADLSADRTAIDIRIPVGIAAVDRLGKWLDGESLPWRLAIARDAARRAGGDLELQTKDGEMRLRWRLPLAEEGSHDNEAGGPDRRRRSRGS